MSYINLFIYSEKLTDEKGKPIYRGRNIETSERDTCEGSLSQDRLSATDVESSGANIYSIDKERQRLTYMKMCINV